jgi:hypothetical protein
MPGHVLPVTHMILAFEVQMVSHGGGNLQEM